MHETLYFPIFNFDKYFTMKILCIFIFFKKICMDHIGNQRRICYESKMKEFSIYFRINLQIILKLGLDFGKGPGKSVENNSKP